MQVRRITPSPARFVDILKNFDTRIGQQETKPAGSVVIRETLTTTDPATGVQTIFGQLPDGNHGLQLWVGDTTPPPVPSAPVVSSALGTITILWSGSFSGTAVAPPDFDHINAYSQNVTGGPVSLAGSMRNANDSVIFSGVALPGDKWVCWLTALDANGNESAASIYSAPITVASVLDDSGLSATLANNQTQIDQANANIATANAAIATKSTISSQSTAPTGAHSGDYWLDTSNGNKPMFYNGTAWVSVQDAAINQAMTSANGKNTIFFQSTTPSSTGRVLGDLWFDTSNGNRPNTWSGTAWVSAQDASIATAQSAANTAQTTANGKNTIISAASAPATAGHINGDIWFDTSNGNKPMVFSTNAWVSAQDASIATAQTTANGKNTIVSASTAPTGTHVTGDVWFDTSNGNRPNTWSGTAWVSAQDASIATAQSAANTAQTTANGKNTIISAASAPATAGHINGDIWFDTAHGNKPMVFSTNAWVSAQDASIATAQTTATNAQTSANGKNTIKYSSSAASGTGTAVGDVWFQTNSNGNVIGQWQWSGSAWIQQVIDNSLIAANIDAGKISTGYIAAGRIQAGTITASMIATDTITAGNIAAGAITASEISTGAVTATALSANSVSATAMVANTITAGQIAAGTITTNEIKAGTITASDIATDTITAGNIAAGAITASEISTGAVTATALSANSVSATAMVANTITAGQIAAGTITTNEIKANTITAANIAANTITASQIAASTITATQIASNAITATKLAANSVTASAIAAGTITATQIKGSTITSNQIAVGTITSANIAASAITSDKISAGAIDGLIITGATIRTAATGARSVMDASGINAYDSTGANYFSLGASGLVAEGTFSTSFVDQFSHTLTISMAVISPNVGNYRTAGISLDSSARTDGVPPTVYSNDGSTLFLASGSNGSTRRGSSISVDDNGTVAFDALTVDFSGGGAAADLIDVNSISKSGSPKWYIPGPWTTLPLPSGWFTSGGFGFPAQYRLIDGGVQLRGVAFKTASPILINDVVCTLPVTTTAAQYFEQKSSGPTIIALQTDPNGTLWVQAINGASGAVNYVSLDRIFYYAS